MKELVYKTVDGIQPRKKEISIEEIEDRKQTHITKKWVCKYFVKSRREFSAGENMQRWLAVNQHNGSNVKNCHIFRHLDAETGDVKILCKVIGEFFVVKGLTVMSILYANSLRVHMSHAEQV